MKLMIGITRRIVFDKGTVVVQKPEDTLTLTVPDDGYEFLDRIWLQTEDGETLLDLPLTFGPMLTNLVSEVD